MNILELVIALAIAAAVYGITKIRKLNTLLQIFLSLLSFIIAMIVF